MMGFVMMLLMGCSIMSMKNVNLSDDPIADMANTELTFQDRSEAVWRAWTQVVNRSVQSEGQSDSAITRQELRKTFRALIWSSKTNIKIRLAALQALISDTTDDGRADTRQFVRLILPREKNLTILTVLSATAAEQGWQEITPALVRSLSRPFRDVADEERPEYKALYALNAGDPIEWIVFRVFLTPTTGVGGVEDRLADRTRADAWSLLSRLNRIEAIRTALLGGQLSPPDSPEGKRVLEALQVCARELRAVPQTGDQLEWVRMLRDLTKPGNEIWWEQASSAITQLDENQRLGLMLRHAEPVRWASTHRPDLIALSRNQLQVKLLKQLAGRKTHHRAKDSPGTRISKGEKLASWADELTWGDLLTIAVIDEVIRKPDVIKAMFTQARMDLTDKTTEYGGLIFPEGEDEQFKAKLYPPRPSERLGDRRFVASRDMIKKSAHALAHYHFHAQDWANNKYAGPSLKDYDYSDRYGRPCLVLTGVKRGVLGVDYYQPGGATIDLGEIRDTSR